MKLSEDHRKAISRSQRQRWERRRQINSAQSRVIDAARSVAYADGHDKRFKTLRAALKELDDALAGN